ncbi:hypothetical protein [Massilia sp. DD77]|uniref:hypothetical protein n=1 Tax=Massilia sp. DD77 TaxID=3109349 RepID=UPI002FFFA0D4
MAALICALGYIGLRTTQARGTEEGTAAHKNVIKMAPRVIHLTTILPEGRVRAHRGPYRHRSVRLLVESG